MAMLAEPRQRKRYNLVPRGKALYEDDSRFGTKMLEKMGWSKGKGLGPNEDGSPDFVRLRYKNDIQGLGYEQRDDQWTQHESSFNGLLSSLNAENTRRNLSLQEVCAESDDNEPGAGFGFHHRAHKSEKAKLKEKISGVSLEEKSKQSKARVHYKKFTKGKDLSQYSEKDLANIFGRKAINGQENNSPDNNSNSHEDVTSDNFGSVQTFSTGVSVSDYFKIKMASKKCLAGRKTQEEGICGQTDAEQQMLDKIKRKKERDQQNKSENTAANVQRFDEENADNIVMVPQTVCQKSKMKRKRPREYGDAVEIADDESLEKCEKYLGSNTIKKNKKCAEEGHSIEIKESKERGIRKNIETAKNIQMCTSDEVVQREFCKPKIRENDHKGNIVDAQPMEPDQFNNSKVMDRPIKKKKGKKTKVSEISKSNSELQTVEDLQNEIYSIKDLKAKLNLFNVYRLSSFCAEKFRNLNLSFFPDSSLAQIEGYGLNQDIQLEIESIKTDEMRITKLWENTWNKYALMGKETKRAYQKYVKETYEARKRNQKKPSLHFKTWKRKNAFAVI